MIDQARVAVAGVGKNISALVQGIVLYRATGSLAGILRRGQVRRARSGDMPELRVVMQACGHRSW